MNNIVVLHIPHSSSFIPREERKSILLSDAELALELLKMTDWYTEELFRLGTEKYRVIYPISRLVLDPERFIDDKMESMAKIGMGVIYTNTVDGRDLRRELNHEMRQDMLEKYYFPHHMKLLQAVRSMLKENGQALIIDCHSFSSSALPYEKDRRLDQPDVCIGTDSFHTPSSLSKFVKDKFEEIGFSVAINYPFSGVLIPNEYFRKEIAVKGLMIEINRKLYMDEITGERLSEFDNIKGLIAVIISDLSERLKLQ